MAGALFYFFTPRPRFEDREYDALNVADCIHEVAMQPITRDVLFDGPSLTESRVQLSPGGTAAVRYYDLKF